MVTVKNMTVHYCVCISYFYLNNTVENIRCTLNKWIQCPMPLTLNTLNKDLHATDLSAIKLLKLICSFSRHLITCMSCNILEIVHLYILKIIHFLSSIRGHASRVSLFFSYSL